MEIEDDEDYNSIPEDEFGPIDDESEQEDEQDESRTIKHVKNLEFFQVILLPNFSFLFLIVIYFIGIYASSLRVP